jgi:carboxylesterase
MRSGLAACDDSPMSSPHPGTLLPGAEPFEHTGGPVGVLLCHGFTGSPQTLRTWADYLAAQGLSVSLPRLPGHGTRWQDLARTGGDDWYAAVDTAFGALAARCGTTFVFGLSMGGCLALRLAENHGGAVRGLVLVNPSLVPDTRLFLVAPVLKHVLRALPGIASDIKKPGCAEVGYDRVPVRAAATLPKLWRATVKDLHRVTQPVLVYRSSVDHVVGPASMRALLAGVPGGQVTVRELPDSYHVATLDNDAQTIFEGSWKFIQDHPN